MKLWQGRTSGEVNEMMSRINNSILVDCKLYKQDITGSIAHAAMLGECGIIDKTDSQSIVKSLKKILSDIESGKLDIDLNVEDIHTFVEKILTERIGDAGKKLHTARSRNDQVALDMRMFVKDKIKDIRVLLNKLIETLTEIAAKNVETYMPAYTHLQRAQPVTFGHYMMAYVEMLTRDIARLDDCYTRTDVMPLGSCALAGTTYPIDRKIVADALGFSKISDNSLDAVSDRDYLIEFLSAIAIVSMHLSRFSEEIVLWTSSEFNFVQLDEKFTTGSSAMPQKRNSDAAELVRGKSGRIFGGLMSLLTMMKGLPLSYNKDMQEDKCVVFAAIDHIELCLNVFVPMIATMKINVKRMSEACSGGFVNATDCADYLVKKGMPFRDAYKIVGSLVNFAEANGLKLEEIGIEEYKKASPLFAEDIYKIISIEACVKNRKCHGGPAPVQVSFQIKKHKK